MTQRTISVNYLARVEGEGAMHVEIDGGKVSRVELRIFEPPRFFEAFLQGRDATEAPDITSRICGICPIAYQMSACEAMEEIFGVELPDPLWALRRAIYCGEWIESHALHVFMLHAPDFMGFEGAIEMAKVHPERVKAGLKLKKVGNELLNVLGGRDIHPINLRVGGFHRLPRPEEIRTLIAALESALPLAEEALRWVSTFSFPELERPYEFLALSTDTYPLERGQLANTAGLRAPIREYLDYYQEVHVPHSTALHSRRVKGPGTEKGGVPYLVGPLARYHLAHKHLSPRCQELAREVGLKPGCLNPFRSIQVRALEVYYAVEEALRLLKAFSYRGPAFVPFTPRAGVGHGATEAPRGLIYHRYEVDSNGKILSARIVPPTSQNQPTIEGDLFQVVTDHVSLADGPLQHLCEQAIRNYDPCISCSTHFLKLQVTRRD